MAQFYTLNEAARVLGIAPEALKAKAQSREVRAFLDGGSWRFRVVDIDELARRQGLGSDAELPLSDLDLPVGSGQPGQKSDILDFSDFQLSIAPTDIDSSSAEIASERMQAGEGKQHGGSDSSYHVFLDDLVIPPGPVTASSSVMIGMSDVIADLDDAEASGFQGGAGQVRGQDPLLATPEPDQPGIADRAKLPADSDVLLVSADPSTGSPGDSEVQLVGDDSFSSDSWDIDSESLPLSGSSSSSSSELQALEPESSAEFKPTLDRNFESSGPFVVTGLGSDVDLGATLVPLPSDSDVKIAGKGSASGDLVQPSDSAVSLVSDSGVTLASDPGVSLVSDPGVTLVSDSGVTLASDSGVTLEQPIGPTPPNARGASQSSDSGVTLERPSGLNLGLDSLIGLAPLPEEETRPPSIKQPLARPEESKKEPPQTSAPAAKHMADDSGYGSDFDLSISAIIREKDDPTVLEQEESDFELDERDSGSEVFAVGEEQESDQNAATALPAPVDFDEDEDDETELPVVAAETRQGTGRDTLSTIAGELLTSQPGREHRRVRVPSLMTASSDLEYSGLTIGLLSMAVLIMLFAAFVVNDLAHYEGFPQDGWNGSGLIRQIAGLFGGR